MWQVNCKNNRWVCDGNNYCDDDSDEKDCDKYTVLMTDRFVMTALTDEYDSGKYTVTIIDGSVMATKAVMITMKNIINCL